MFLDAGLFLAGPFFHRNRRRHERPTPAPRQGWSSCASPAALTTRWGRWDDAVEGAQPPSVAKH